MSDISFSMQTLSKLENGDENPFITLEALGEHVQSAFYCAGQLGLQAPIENGERTNCEKPGTLQYHLHAIEKYEHEMLEMLIALIPEFYLAAEYHKPIALPPNAHERLQVYLNYIGYKK